GRRLGDRARCHGSAGTAAVLHHDLLAKRLAHALGGRAGKRVVAAARRERHHQGDGPNGIILRGGGGRRQHGQRRRAQDDADTAARGRRHESLPRIFSGYSAASAGGAAVRTRSLTASHSSAPTRANASRTVMLLLGTGWRPVRRSSANVASQTPMTALNN